MPDSLIRNARSVSLRALGPAAAGGDRLADLDDLLVRDGQAARDPRRVKLDPEPGEYRRRLGAHRPPVDAPPGPQRLAPDEHVLRDGQVREQRGLLVDDRDPRRLRHRRTMQRDLLAIDRQGARVRLVYPGQDLHQGRLARAVLPDEGVHLPWVQLDGSVQQRVHGAEGLRGVAQHQHRPETPRRARGGRPGPGHLVSPAARDPGARDPGARDPGARDPGARDPGARDPTGCLLHAQPRSSISSSAPDVTSVIRSFINGTFQLVS
jgi:hypothetical protein